ncbi:Uncharacterised protein [Pantoea agglomerans]|uniref:Uncharacterized protein n=1 Tax=Enterobacter agglomerans TaxID=549 RepID=A0A379AHF6_ENTAG|nr:Uncharacterised protein [Pantoea agglomerans]
MRQTTVWIPVRSGFTDIGNAADYRVSHSGGSIALSSGGGMGAQMLSSVASNAASTLLSGLNNNGHAEGTTQSAVANGTVIIRDRVNQKAGRIRSQP